MLCGVSRNTRLLILAGVIAIAVVGGIVAAVLGHSSSKGTVKTLPAVTTSASTSPTASTTTAVTAKQRGLAELKLERSALALLFEGIPQHGTILGKPSAPATLAVYEDPQCPYCAQWNLDTLATVMAQFVRTGRVKLEYRGIEIIGANSVPGLRAIEAAGIQNKLWNMNEAFYEHQGKENSGWITAPVVAALGQVAQVNVKKLFVDANSAAVTAALRQSAAQAAADKIGGTPSFVLLYPPAVPKPLQITSLEPATFVSALTAALG
jgi:protein-disulfide isomerase